MAEKIKADVDRLRTFGLKNEKNSILAKYIGTLFFLIKTQYSLSMSVFILSTVSHILKTKFYVFGIQTCRN